MLEVFTLASELVDDPVTCETDELVGDANNAMVTMAYALKKVREETDNARVELKNYRKHRKRRRRPIPKKSIG